MAVKKREFLLIVLALFCTITIKVQSASSPDNRATKKSHRKKKKSERSRQKKEKNEACAKRFVSNLFWDALELNKNLFHWDSFKIISTMFPIWVATRMADDHLQNCFYDGRYHANVHQMQPWAHEIGRLGVGIPVVIFAGMSIFSSRNRMRETSRDYLIGLPFVWMVKNLIKKLDFDENLRPWHENWSPCYRSKGGFPSGHVAIASYVAMLYGLQFGPRYGIPLGALAVVIGGVFVNGNRHYLSQVVAGAALGTLYAFAVDKLIDSNLKKCENLAINLAINEYGAPAINFSYSF